MKEKGSNLPLVKQRNCLLVRKMIYQQSPISRIEIAQKLALTAPTITSIVAPMVSSGLVREFSDIRDDEKAKVPGRRPVMLDYVATAKYVCGIELGPYHTSMVVTDLRGNVVAHQQLDPLPDDYQASLDLLISSVPAFLASVSIPHDKFLGFGVTLPGFINGTTGRIYTTFRHDWIGRDLAADLSSALSAPVIIENNVRARAIASTLLERYNNMDSLAYFFVSHGLACPIIVDGKILYGHSAGAGEVGHTIVDPGGPVCETCGNSGCLEAVASQKAILRRCQIIMRTHIDTILNHICPNPEELTIDMVLKAQECEDPAVNNVVSGCLSYLGISLANIINLISPKNVLVDGHLMVLERNRTRLLEVVQKNVFASKIRSTAITFVPYSPLRGAAGAAAIAINSFLLEAAD